MISSLVASPAELAHDASLGHDEQPVGHVQRLLELRGGEQDGRARAGPARVISSKISALAPTSMPRVGSSSSSTRGSVSSALPSTTFCWLPPLSDAIGASGPLALTVTSRIDRRRPRRALAVALTTHGPRRSAAGWRASGSGRPTSTARARRAGGPRARASSPRSMRSAIGLPVERCGRRARPAADRRHAAGQRLEQLGAPRAHQPVEADDLAGAHGQRDAVDREPAGVARVGDDELLDLEQLVAGLGVLAREQLVGVAARPSARRSTSMSTSSASASATSAAVAQRRPRGRRSRAPPRGGARCRRSPTPSAVSSRMTRNSTSTSAALSADVGSSMISTRASCASARAISTICCWPSRRSPTGVRGSSGSSRRSISSRGDRARRAWSTMTPRRTRSRAMNTLSAMLRFGKRLSSWWMIAMPRSAASRGGQDHGLAVELELPGRRPLDPGEDLHQRRLAGAVLAEQRGDRGPARPRSRRPSARAWRRTPC